MATVSELLDDLVAGRTSLDEVADDFRQRTWPKPAPATVAQQWGVTDDDSPDPDSWKAVDANSALTSTQYEALAEAYNQALQRSATKS